METLGPVNMAKIDLNNLNGKKILPDKGFQAEIYNQLPWIFKEGCNELTDPNEKAVFLIGALGVVSGLLPNIWGLYDGQQVNANLYVYLLGRYGGGKGSLMYSKMLGFQIHKSMIEVSKADNDQFEIENELYKAEFQKWKKSKIGDPPKKPIQPQQKLLFIPANNSKSGLFELLSGNEESGIMFESEGDTLADAIRQDYGNFSDGLRKAFHHESISFYRRLNKEFIEIENPKISVVISSTFDQLLALIPTAENGLFSRFLFYELPHEPKFRNVFDASKDNYLPVFSGLGEQMKQVYEYFKADTYGFKFQLTEPQQAGFIEYFRALKLEIQDNLTFELDGTINRLGLQFFRIAMIFTTLRQYYSSTIDREMFCSDQDFQLTKNIISELKNHALNIYFKLPEPKPVSNKFQGKAETVQQAIELHNSGLSYGEISQRIYNNPNHKSTIYRWIHS
jgi:hypothetical protein